MDGARLFSCYAFHSIAVFYVTPTTGVHFVALVYYDTLPVSKWPVWAGVHCVVSFYFRLVHTLLIFMGYENDC